MRGKGGTGHGWERQAPTWRSKLQSCEAEQYQKFKHRDALGTLGSDLALGSPVKRGPRNWGFKRRVGARRAQDGP